MGNLQTEGMGSTAAKRQTPNEAKLSYLSGLLFRLLRLTSEEMGFAAVEDGGGETDTGDDQAERQCQRK